MTHEIECSGCAQKIMVERGACPYCHKVIDSYWYHDMGEIKQAVIFYENGERFILVEGKKLDASSEKLPDSIKKLIKDKKARDFKNSIIKLFERILFDR